MSTGWPPREGPGRGAAAGRWPSLDSASEAVGHRSCLLVLLPLPLHVLSFSEGAGRRRPLVLHGCPARLRLQDWTAFLCPELSCLFQGLGPGSCRPGLSWPAGQELGPVAASHTRPCRRREAGQPEGAGRRSGERHSVGGLLLEAAFPRGQDSRDHCDGVPCTALWLQSGSQVQVGLVLLQRGRPAEGGAAPLPAPAGVSHPSRKERPPLSRGPTPASALADLSRPTLRWAAASPGAGRPAPGAYFMNIRNGRLCGLPPQDELRGQGWRLATVVPPTVEKPEQL